MAADGSSKSSDSGKSNPGRISPPRIPIGQPELIAIVCHTAPVSSTALRACPCASTIGPPPAGRGVRRSLGVVDGRRGREAGGDDRLERIVDVPGDVGDRFLGHEEGEPGGRHESGHDVDGEDRPARGDVPEGVGHQSERPHAGVGELDEDHALEARTALELAAQRDDHVPDRAVDGVDDRDTHQEPLDQAVDPRPQGQAEEIEGQDREEDREQGGGDVIPPAGQVLERGVVADVGLHPGRQRRQRVEHEAFQREQQPVDDRERDRDRQGEDQSADQPVAERLARRRADGGRRGRRSSRGGLDRGFGRGGSIHARALRLAARGPADGRPASTHGLRSVAGRGPRAIPWAIRRTAAGRRRMGAPLACGAARR